MTHHLDATGSAALQEVALLRQVVASAEQELRDIQSRIDAAHPEIEDEWAGFRDRLHAVTARAAEEVTHVRDLGAPTAAALEALQKTVDALPDEVQALFARASEKLERYAEWCAEREAELRQRAELVESAALRLTEKATRLATTFQEAAVQRADALQKFSTTLEGFHGADASGAHHLSATERHAMMVDGLQTRSGNLDHHETELLEELSRNRQSLESELAAVLGTSEEATAASLEHWRGAHGRFFDEEVEPRVTSALTALAEHQADTAEDSAATEVSNEELEQGHQELRGQLGAVSSTVEGFLGLLSQFTFIRF